MKKLSLLVLVLLASNSYAADAYNGKEYKMRQSLQNLNITGTGNNSIDINGGGDIDGQLTINSTLTVTGNAFSVGGSTLVVSGGKVGIGTTAPLNSLYVSGDAKITGNTAAGSSLVDLTQIGTARALTITRNAVDGSRPVVQISHTGSGPQAAFLIQQIISTAAAVAVNTDASLTVFNARINGDGSAYLAGNVGIGTAAPDSKISISSSTTSTAFVSFLGAMTKAEILAFDPVQAGASAYCTDCTAATLCISTGATASQFADIGDRTVACN